MYLLLSAQEIVDRHLLDIVYKARLVFVLRDDFRCDDFEGRDVRPGRFPLAFVVCVVLDLLAELAFQLHQVVVRVFGLVVIQMAEFLEVYLTFIVFVKVLEDPLEVF